MTFLVDRIAAYLCTHGPTSSVDIAKALDLATVRVSDAVRRAPTRARYGLYVVGHAAPAGYPYATPPRVWAVKADVYRQYLASKGAKAKPCALHVVREAKPKQEVAGVTPAYTGPTLTRWLPSSPYHMERT